MWSTFVPYIPNTMFPGMISFVTAVTYVLMVSIALNISVLEIFKCIHLIFAACFIMIKLKILLDNMKGQGKAPFTHDSYSNRPSAILQFINIQFWID